MSVFRVNTYKTTEGYIMPKALKLIRKHDTKKCWIDIAGWLM